MRPPIAVAVLALVASGARAQAPRVVVRDSVDTRIPFATVQAGGSVMHLASDSGVALLRVPSADSLKLLVRRIGFEPVERWVRPDAAGDFHVVMRPLPRNIGSVTIFARDTPLARSGFYDRMQRVERGATSARFWTPEAIDLRNPTRISALLEGESIVRVRPFSRKPVLTGRGGSCPMGILVDGQRMTQTVEDITTLEGEREIKSLMQSQRLSRDQAEAQFIAMRSSVDELVNAMSVVAVEVYASMAGVPAELQRNAPRNACGLVVLWTGSR